MRRSDRRLHVFGGEAGFAICDCNLQEVADEAEQAVADDLGYSSLLVVSRARARDWLAEHLASEHSMRPEDPGVEEFIDVVLELVWRRCAVGHAGHAAVLQQTERRGFEEPNTH